MCFPHHKRFSKCIILLMQLDCFRNILFGCDYITFWCLSNARLGVLQWLCQVSLWCNDIKVGCHYNVTVMLQSCCCHIYLRVYIPLVVVPGVVVSGVVFLALFCLCFGLISRIQNVTVVYRLGYVLATQSENITVIALFRVCLGYTLSQS